MVKLKNESKKSTKKDETITALRSGNPAKKAEAISKVASSVSRPVSLGKSGLNPPWLIPTMVGLMVVGIIWIVIFYLTANLGGYPIPALKYGNLVVGFGLVMTGFGLSVKWH